MLHNIRVFLLVCTTLLMAGYAIRFALTKRSHPQRSARFLAWLIVFLTGLGQACDLWRTHFARGSAAYWMVSALLLVLLMPVLFLLYRLYSLYQRERELGKSKR